MGRVFKDLGSQRLWSYLLVVWNRISNGNGWYVPILSFDSGLSCITPTHGFILVLEDILSDQILNCSLIMQSHQCISIIGKSSCMRCVTLGGHLLVRCDTCKHPATCPRWMSAAFQDGWSSDRTKPQNVFLGTSLSHPALTEAAALSEFYLMEVQNNCLELSPSSMAKLSVYLMDTLNYNISRANMQEVRCFYLN